MFWGNPLGSVPCGMHGVVCHHTASGAGEEGERKDEEEEGGGEKGGMLENAQMGGSGGSCGVCGQNLSAVPYQLGCQQEGKQCPVIAAHMSWVKHLFPGLRVVWRASLHVLHGAR